MIEMIDCPSCGTTKIRSTVRVCGECEISERYESQIAELRERAERAERERDEALAVMSERESPTAGELLGKGGEWLCAARTWLKWHRKNGDRVAWGSSDVLEPAFTVRDVEDLAADVAAAAMSPQINERILASRLRRQWEAEARAKEMLERAEKAEARVRELEAERRRHTGANAARRPTSACAR